MKRFICAFDRADENGLGYRLDSDCFIDADYPCDAAETFCKANVTKSGKYSVIVVDVENGYVFRYADLHVSVPPQRIVVLWPDLV